MTFSVTDGNLPIFPHAKRKSILEKKKKNYSRLGKFVLLVPTAERSTMPNLWLCMSIINCLRDWQEGTEKTPATAIFTSEHSWKER